MKTFTLMVFVFLMVFGMSAQKIYIKQALQNNCTVKLLRLPHFEENNNNLQKPELGLKPSSQSYNATNGVSESMIGSTVYDAQTNSSVANRIYAYPDGTIGAIWTMGFAATAYGDRGTGYNYFDGSSWGEEPTTRIESVRTGWPSYFPLGTGEIIVAHDFINGLQISKRPEKGSGSWTTTFLAAPAGATKVSWPRIITVGNTVHVLAISGVAYQGLDLALLYYRSADGGSTWADPIIIPGLDAASLGAGAGKSFTGFSSDAYAWAAPKGDTIAFAIASSFGGVWIMKSFDNGLNWTKITVLTIPVFEVAPTPIIPSVDGSVSLALDGQGMAHIIFGRMNVSDDDFTTAGYSYYPYTDGLVYWNENMSQLDTTKLGNPDVLEENGNLIAWMKDFSQNGSIDFPEVANGEFPFGLYGTSLSSMGQIVIDKEDNIYVTFSSCREDLVNASATPNAQVYRHLFKIEKKAGQPNWSPAIDLTDDIEHSYDECVFASLAQNVTSGFSTYLNIVYHLDSEPGTSIGDDGDAPADNYVNYMTVFHDVAVKNVDIAKYVSLAPNPSHDFVELTTLVKESDNVSVRINDSMGKLLSLLDFGYQNAGYHTFNIDVNSFSKGLYLFNVKIGYSETSQKVIVQ